ncbi:MAG: tRNA pseudouridine32 synthase/23S rRNA pseudouridine746 synthase [Arenicella sp.]|jgi:tRNA pseudouridine32 synthase/23S rRNA pseudouridine746 synthase
MKADTFIAPPCHEQIRVLFEDSHLILIDKPSGLLSLSGKNPLNKDSVHYRLVQNYPTATMVHRLDLGTSGVMLLALKKEVNANLTKQFQERSIIKKYTAILFGHLDDDEGMINARLTKAQFPYQKVCETSGKEAQSHYQVLERMQDSVTGIKTTRVLFTPRTGRTHQLRVHSQEIGHPIIGCDLYGLDIKGLGDTQSLASRLALHANSLEFTHPVTEQRMLIESPQLLTKSILQ